MREKPDAAAIDHSMAAEAVEVPEAAEVARRAPTTEVADPLLREDS